ncbi:hypothetical protein PFISCL1PPCAC_25396 [Pristionchus fissidentatus]|uniref:Saposin B-type domain-containing protein n=1 Tax=Pristionchus fissidentatus TaxID=1538716 RepID=A0AAV5WPQ7_9BILA|nr:hypothetical protein PFISCL1PPCAC_25396 [Pristionchus fissidentatus]
MMRTVVAVSALLAVCFSVPLQLQDNCGAVSIQISAAMTQKWTSKALSKGAECQICLDLAILADNYIDCAEGMLQSAANNWCEKTFTDNYYRNVCYDLVNQIADTLEKETDERIVPNVICTKIMNEPCGQAQ